MNGSNHTLGIGFKGWRQKIKIPITRHFQTSVLINTYYAKFQSRLRCRIIFWKGESKSHILLKKRKEKKRKEKKKSQERSKEK
jgi:hypothetical protein